MTPQEIEDRAFADPATIPAGLAELEQQAEAASPDSDEYKQVIDASRTLHRLQPAG
jgi:hypothetical protein